MMITSLNIICFINFNYNSSIYSIYYLIDIVILVVYMTIQSYINFEISISRFFPYVKYFLKNNLNFFIALTLFK